METMQMSCIETKAAKFFDRIAEVDLLIIEDFGMRILDGQQLLDYMELTKDRHARKSTIISSKLPVKNWHDIVFPIRKRREEWRAEMRRRKEKELFLTKQMHD